MKTAVMSVSYEEIESESMFLSQLERFSQPRSLASLLRVFTQGIVHDRSEKSKLSREDLKNFWNLIAALKGLQREGIDFSNMDFSSIPDPSQREMLHILTVQFGLEYSIEMLSEIYDLALNSTGIQSTDAEEYARLFLTLISTVLNE
jgi:hypothetical protein